MKFNLRDQSFWPANRTAIIAEIGINHGGDEALALEMIQTAHKNGADFVKLQSYITKEFLHEDCAYFESIKSMELSFEAQKRLFKKAKEMGINLASTPFDFHSADLVDEFEPPFFKVASMDNDNVPLLRYIAQKGRIVIVSCGMANLSDVQKIVKIMEEAGNEKLILLHCISDYPAKPEDLNLSMINLLKQTFGYPAGLSDHAIGLFSSFIAASLGAAVIEKHFTIDKSLAEKYPDADHEISILPEELRCLREFCETAPVMTGNSQKGFTEKETAKGQEIKRGLYARRDIEGGDKISLENTMLLRPVRGIKAALWDEVNGKTAKRKILRHQPILFSDLNL